MALCGGGVVLLSVLETIIRPTQALFQLHNFLSFGVVDVLLEENWLKFYFCFWYKHYKIDRQSKTQQIKVTQKDSLQIKTIAGIN